MVKAPPAVWPPTSVAVTVLPDPPVGTVNVQVYAPVPPAVRLPDAHVEIVFVSKTRPTGLVTEKPVPETVTVAPMGPWPGETAIVGVVTVNAPVAVWPPSSVAVTVVPEVPEGTTNVQLNAPPAPVVNEPDVQVEIALVSNDSPTEFVTENPVPATTTVAPTGPWPGVTVIAGTVTVNPVVTVCPDPVSVTVIVWSPADDVGTTNVHVAAPPADVEKDPAVQVEIEVVANLIDTVLLTVKPVPLTVTELPTGPWVGDAAPSAGTVTV
jgi:hypothetical protein